jgi:DNA-binding transcriptional MerR regulator
MKEFSASDARMITGATQRQLDYWDERQIVPASLGRKEGKGNERKYSYADLVKLRVVVELRKAGLSLQRIRKALTVLNDWEPETDALVGKKLVTDGRDVLITTSDSQVLKSVLKRGQLAFSVVFLGEAVSAVARKIDLYLKRKATG